MAFKAAVMIVLLCWCVALEAQIHCERTGGPVCPPGFKRELPEKASSSEDFPHVEQRNQATRDFLQMKSRLYKQED